MKHYNRRFLRRSAFKKQGYDGVYKAKVRTEFDLTANNSSAIVQWDN